ncbi:PilZ domain-containing protein [Metasolibacillus meyeri]|uniref:PilZ domain-containing protein n=1 Tax=Metasolibacillus meyeri TaxID=1071052 RepID=A0AAW9NVD1_9BACL|nr:PilZ domain-containing protein [Metasolibacillus meyeri]MEC1178863.1 PilZ domain-containing protein [Metasolibacillus meyeri]
MFFKRQEGFRFAFDEPIQAKVKKLINNQSGVKNDGEIFEASILDISPHGIKMFAEANFNENVSQAPLVEVQFVLDSSEIVGVGEIVWTKEFGQGKQYGIIFHDQSSLEDLIISELKVRRKKEIAQAKLTNS